MTIVSTIHFRQRFIYYSPHDFISDTKTLIEILRKYKVNNIVENKAIHNIRNSTIKKMNIPIRNPVRENIRREVWNIKYKSN